MKTFSLPASIDAFIFDVDGTLYSDNDYGEAQFTVQFQYLAETRGGTAGGWEERVERFRAVWAAEHDGKSISLGNTLKEFGIDLDESIRMRETLLKPEDYLRPDPRLRETLSILATAARLAVVTNNPTSIGLKTLQALGVADQFAAVVGLERCRVSKPHEAPFKLAASLIGVAEGNCVSIGDRYDIDISLPLALGMGGILVDGVDDVYAIPEVLRRTERNAIVKT